MFNTITEQPLSHVRIDRTVAEEIKAIVEADLKVPVSMSTAVEKILNDVLAGMIRPPKTGQ